MTASLVFLSLQWLMVRPMRRVTESLVAFREAPEDPSSDVALSERSDEIGVAQRELAEMQHGLRAALRQRAHLAAVGSAVSKIHHDLRNILSTAVLVSDRLAHSDDPEVKRQTPALMAAIDRALSLCEDTVSFARAGGPEPRRERIDLAALVDEVGSALAVPADGVAWHNDVPGGFTVSADRDQLFRVLFNLGRNAVQAMDGAGEVRVSARHDDSTAVIEVADSGPGLPPKAREHLFEPFAGSTRPGGTGLGLPIAREIMHAHGGALRLARSDETGTAFRLELPPR